MSFNLSVKEFDDAVVEFSKRNTKDGNFYEKLDTFRDQKIKINPLNYTTPVLANIALAATMNKHWDLYETSNDTYKYTNASDDKYVIVNKPIDVIPKEFSESKGEYEDIIKKYLWELNISGTGSGELCSKIILKNYNKFNTIAPNHPKREEKYYSAVMELLAKQTNYVIVGSSAVYFMTDKVKFTPGDLDLIDISRDQTFDKYITKVFIPNLGDNYLSREFVGESRCIIRTTQGVNIDIFRTRGSALANVSKYHFSCVRMGITNDDGKFNTFAYPSAILSYAGKPCIIDIRNGFDKRNPFEMLMKYEERGFEIKLGKRKMQMYITYKNMVDSIGKLLNNDVVVDKKQDISAADVAVNEKKSSIKFAKNMYTMHMYKSHGILMCYDNTGNIVEYTTGDEYCELRHVPILTGMFTQELPDEVKKIVKCMIEYKKKNMTIGEKIKQMEMFMKCF